MTANDDRADDTKLSNEDLIRQWRAEQAATPCPICGKAPCITPALCAEEQERPRPDRLADDQLVVDEQHHAHVVVGVGRHGPRRAL